jgi:hypothetical protein
MKYIIYIALAIVFCGCSCDCGRSDDFGFILKYGVGAGNIVNTFEDTYTRDMIVEKDTTIDFTFSNEEMTEIKKMMIGINIMNYPEEFTPPMSDSSDERFGRMVMPHPTYEIIVRIDGRRHEIIWHDSNESIASRAVKLRKMILRILKIIHNKEVIKNLPEPEGAYL